MNIADVIRGFNLFDLVVILGLGTMFILGFIQGTVRRILGIASILFSFLVAVSMREPLGGFLASNWTQFDDRYAVMIGFLAVFLAGSIGFTVLIQGFYKKAPLFEKNVVVDEVIGGLLGIVQGVLILMAIVIILDSAFEVPGLTERNELPLLRGFHDWYDPSATAAFLRSTVIPGFYSVFGLFIPDALREINRNAQPFA